ncbi:MAG TPA: O-antigen ligase family protein [Myxococcota bacterium]|nr:O-antigen ligase family protein [Myxococcota bacterium]
MFDALGYAYLPFAFVALALMFWRPIVALVFLAAIFPLDEVSPRLGVPGINTETILLLTAFFVTVLRFGPRFPPLRYSAPVTAFIVVMGIGFALSIPWALKMTVLGGQPAIWVTFKEWKSTTFSTLFFFSTYWWFQRPEDRRYLLEAISVSVLISCVVALLDLYVFQLTEGAGFGRATGLQGDPNGTGCAIGSMMFASLYLAFYAGNDLPRVRRIFHFGVYLLAFVTVVLSQSRGNYVALVAAHLLFFGLVSRTLLLASVVSLALFSTVAFPLLPSVIRERIEMTVGTGSGYRVAGAEYVEGSTAQRLVFIRTGYDMFRTSPLWGRGLNFFFFRTPEFSAKYGSLDQRDAHNLVIKMGVEMGLIGLGALFWMWLAVLWCGWQLWRSNAVDYRLGAVALASGVHVILASLSTNSFLTTSSVSANFWIVFAMSARAYVSRAAVRDSAPALSPAAGRWRRFSQRPSAAASQL